jgi:FKBP-type peptidyl-prolyl cis-trans isomerase FklB
MSRVCGLCVGALFGLLAVSGGERIVAQEAAGAPEPRSYAVGWMIGNNLVGDGFREGDVKLQDLMRGISDALGGRDAALNEDALQAAFADLDRLLQQRAAEASAKARQRGADFLEQNKAKEGVVVLPSGLQYRVVKSGDGAQPTATSEVRVHYEGRLVDGTVFDSSLQRGVPATFPVSNVIRGWTEALQRMKVGDKWQLFIPPQLAYGDRGAGGLIGPNETLIFDVELLEVMR